MTECKKQPLNQRFFFVESLKEKIKSTKIMLKNTNKNVMRYDILYKKENAYILREYIHKSVPL